MQRIYYHAIEGNEIKERGPVLSGDGAPPSGERSQHLVKQPRGEDILGGQIILVGSAPNTKPLLRRGALQSHYNGDKFPVPRQVKHNRDVDLTD